MPALVAIAVIAGVAGCAPVSQQAAAAKQEQAVHAAIDAQRVCDASTASGHRSLLTWFRCGTLGALPPACEKPGTDDLPVCRQWGLTRLAYEHGIGEAAVEGGVVGVAAF